MKKRKLTYVEWCLANCRSEDLTTKLLTRKEDSVEEYVKYRLKLENK